MTVLWWWLCSIWMIIKVMFPWKHPTTCLCALHSRKHQSKSVLVESLGVNPSLVNSWILAIENDEWWLMMVNILVGGDCNMCLIFFTYWEKSSYMMNMFQRDWNHQPVHILGIRIIHRYACFFFWVGIPGKSGKNKKQ